MYSDPTLESAGDLEAHRAPMLWPKKAIFPSV
jgi:hypothetical protein